jgi:hypothetical protein
MSQKNLYYAQLGEALRLAENNIFEYKRISLILLDNIVENMLISQNSIKLHHQLFMNTIIKSKYDKLISNNYYFDNIIQLSLCLKLINVSEKNVFAYCHNARNNLYHHLFANKQVTDFCILFYCDFLENNFKNYIENSISWSSENEIKSTHEIIKIEGVRDLEDILLKLQEFNNSKKDLPQNILADIIEEYILQIEDTIENETFLTYHILNSTARKFYEHNFENNKYNGLSPSSSISQWYNINENKINELKGRITEIRNVNIETAFARYWEFMIKIEPIYIGIMSYYSSKENLASLNED